MAYSSRTGKRPQEFASKANQSHVINDPAVQEFVKHCRIPLEEQDISLEQQLIFEPNSAPSNPIKNIIAIDGGYTLVPIKKSYPSATMTFFQFGLVSFSLADLEAIAHEPFINPETMHRIKNIQRLQFVLPTENVMYKDEQTFSDSVRRSLYDFFMNKESGVALMDTLAWVLFTEFSGKGSRYTKFASCPNPECEAKDFLITREELGENYSTKCGSCSKVLYLTDHLRLHEKVDEVLGAGGIVSYVQNLIEQMLIASFYRQMLASNPEAISNTLIIKDGPLSFYGQTAPLRTYFRDLCSHLHQKHALYLVGAEKSGLFMEHAEHLNTLLKPGQVFAPNNTYIGKYVRPGTSSTIYGSNTYYSGKVIYKGKRGGTYVLCIPTVHDNVVEYPKREEYINLDIIIDLVERLRSDMYDNALMPIALVNHLVSLAFKPSQKIIERFAKKEIDSTNS